MLDSLRLIYERLIAKTDTTKHRFLYSQFNLDNRLTGLIGARGVGKTTLLLQFIKNNFDNLSQGFYFSADHIYFNQTTLYQFIENTYLTEDTKIFFIDEIHKYANWNQELKNLYDGFPDIKIIFSGSSTLDLIKGSYDLSRRAKLYHLPGMSFREYLNFVTDSQFTPITLNTLLENPPATNQLLAHIPKIKGHFKNYLQQGFYPFYAENPLSYYEKILQIIDKTIFEDIANFYHFKATNLQHLKKLLIFLASIKPGTITIHNLAKNMSIDDKTVMNYLTSLQQTGLVKLIYPAEPGNQKLRRPEKIFLNNTNLQYALKYHLSVPIEIGNVRELFFIQAIENAGLDLFHCKQGDYQVNDYLFEIGGKNKTRKQIQTIVNAFLVKDDIATASHNAIPLFFFGFLY